ncbi:MAG TPA: hypothetical protein VHT91_33015 [Kofleriaceae bacterium]|nr:hypothetical protein [Kofleriaceae bacterium]
MKRAALALVLAACSSSSNDFPPLREGAPPGGTSGGGGGGGTVRDAGIGDGTTDGGVAISGRVCLVQDLRAPTSMCDPTKAGGFTVTLGTAHATDGGTTAVVGTATTALDGSFTMVAPLGPGLIWHVTSPKLTTSVMDFGTENTIPAMLSELYFDLLDANIGRATLEDHGAVALRVVRGLTPVAGIAAMVTPQADSDTFYDSSNSLTDWNPNPNVTQAGGMVWVPDAQLGLAQITLSAAGVTPNTVDTTVENQSITFVTRTIP